MLTLGLAVAMLASAPVCELNTPGWSPNVKAGLERLIGEGAGRGLPAVFDLDNTILCRDIGDAVFDLLDRSGKLQRFGIGAGLAQTPVAAGILPADAGLFDHYTGYLEQADRGSESDGGHADAYAWLTASMRGLTPAEVIAASRSAFRGVEEKLVPQPFIYPEMIELIACLLRNQFQVWIVSATNVWTVRWLVQQELNPRLAERGAASGIALNQVIGLSVKLSGADGRIYRDQELLRADALYARLDEERLKQFVLTADLSYPVSAYGGKAELVRSLVGAQSYLAAGDSPNDLAMLAEARHKLFIARVEKDGYWPRLSPAMRDEPQSWLVQPARAGADTPGFLPQDAGTLFARRASTPRR